MTAEELAAIKNRVRHWTPRPEKGSFETLARLANSLADDRFMLSTYTDAQAQLIAELEAQLAACEQRLDHTLIAYQEASSGALAAAQAVTLTEDERLVVVNARNKTIYGWDVPRLIAIIDRLSNGASTSAQGDAHG